MVEPSQTVHDGIIQRMRVACWITDATDTHSLCNTYCFFVAAVLYANLPHCYNIRTLYSYILVAAGICGLHSS